MSRRYPTYRTFVFTLVVLGTLAGCLPAPYFQKQEAIPQYAWNYNFKPVFSFEITDTIPDYQPYFIIRHTQAYPYNNVWVWVSVKTPGDTVVKKTRVNIVLAEASGKWLGRGMGEIYEQRLPIDLSSVTNFHSAGTYEVSLEQNMRINPLPDVLNVGLRIEKTPFRKN